MPLWWNFRYPLFPFAKSQSTCITNIRTCSFWTFISDNLQLPLMFLVPISENDVIFSKTPLRFKIIITVNVKNCINIWAKVFVIFMGIALLIFIIISTCMVFLRKWSQFLQFSPRLGTREINSSSKFLEIKVKKNMSSNVRNLLKFC